MMHILLFPNQIPSNHLCRNLSTFTPGLASAFFPLTPHIPHLSSSFQSIITVAKNARTFCVLVLQACDQIHGCASCDKTISSPKSPTEAWTFPSSAVPCGIFFSPSYVCFFIFPYHFFLFNLHVFGHISSFRLCYHLPLLISFTRRFILMRFLPTLAHFLCMFSLRSSQWPCSGSILPLSSLK